MKKSLLLLALIPLVSLSFVDKNVPIVESVVNASETISVNLVLTKNGLYNGKQGQNNDELFLENVVTFTGEIGDKLPDESVITSTVNDVVFTNWIYYDGNGKPEVADTLTADLNNQVLYAFFDYEGEYGGGGSSTGETTTIYFQDASWWNEYAAQTSIYLWNANDTNIQNAEFPGQGMTHLKFVPTESESVGYNYWSFEVDLGLYTHVIFTRTDTNDATSYAGAKTVDIELSSRGTNNMYSIVDSQTLFGDPGVSGIWTTYTGE